MLKAENQCCSQSPKLLVRSEWMTLPPGPVDGPGHICQVVCVCVQLHYPKLRVAFTFLKACERRKGRGGGGRENKKERKSRRSGNPVRESSLQSLKYLLWSFMGKVC